MSLSTALHRIGVPDPKAIILHAIEEGRVHFPVPVLRHKTDPARLEYMRRKREEFHAQGLNSHGQPRKRRLNGVARDHAEYMRLLRHGQLPPMPQPNTLSDAKQEVSS